MRVSITKLALLLLACASATACTRNIPNTTVEDSADNRRVIDFVEKYRQAVEARDVGALIAMADPHYLDDNGTPIGTDDIDIEKLQDKLSRWKDRVKDARYEIKYRRVSRDAGKIMVEFRYTASFELTGIDGEDRWSRRLGDHRVVLRADPDTKSYLILSGM